VAHWPVAYTNELKKKSLVVSPEELEKSFADLDKRVERQLYSVGKRAKGEEEEAPDESLEVPGDPEE